MKIQRALGSGIGRLLYNFILILVDQSRDLHEAGDQDASDQHDELDGSVAQKTSADSIATSQSLRQRSERLAKQHFETLGTLAGTRREQRFIRGCALISKIDQRGNDVFLHWARG